MSKVQSSTSTGKRIVRTLSSTVDNIVLLTLLVILMLACYAFWDAHQLYVSADVTTYTEYKPTEENKQSFEELRAMNPDVIGWLTIYDTTIDYPVLRSLKSNDDYLSKNALGEWEGAGSLFIDHNNKADFSDYNTIIYGHHMAGPAMFGELDSFLDKTFFDEHEYANLFYSETGLELVQTTSSNPGQSSTQGLAYEFTTFNGRNHGIQIFAMIQADGHDNSIYTVPATTTEAKQATLKTIAEKAIMVRNLNTGETSVLGKAGAAKPVKTASVDASYFGLTENDHIVLMSTCSADITNGRFVLCGKLLDHEVPNPFPEIEEPKFSVDVFSVLDKFLDRPIWQWVLFLLLLILIVWLLYRAEKYRIKRKRERNEAAK